MTRAAANEGRARAERLAALLAVLAGVALFAIVLARLSPGSAGTMGEDYGYFLPPLLDGTRWAQVNGWWSFPWFTPAFCGGTPAYANMQYPYWSLTQLLAHVMPLLAAVRLAALTLCAVGAAATYGLLRGRFDAGPLGASLGAFLFATNGFFLHRTLIGHLGFQSFALLPAVAWLALGPRRDPAREGLALVGTALLFVYVLHSGGAQLVPPMVLAVATLAAAQGTVARSALRVLGGGAVAMALCAGRLNAILSYFSHFPRDHYGLASLSDLGRSSVVLVQSLFFGGGHRLGVRSLVNTPVEFRQHAFEFSVGAVPLALALVAAFLWWRGRRRSAEPISTARRWQLAAVIGFAAIPWLAATDLPVLSALFRSLPLYGNSVTLVRWWAAYALPLCVLSAVVLSRGWIPISKSALWAGCLVVATAQFLAYDRSYYDARGYNPEPVLAAHARELDTGPRPIEAVVLLTAKGGGKGIPASANDPLIIGGSSLRCYEPIFGYQLEKFPTGSLHPGPARDLAGGEFNFKNPACFVFPDENGCAPGDHFKESERDKLEALLIYRPFAFEVSARQRWAEGLSLVAWALLVLFAAWGAVMVARARRP